VTVPDAGDDESPKSESGKKVLAKSVPEKHFQAHRFQGPSSKRDEVLQSFSEPERLKKKLPKGSKHEHLMRLLVISFDPKQWDEIVELQRRLLAWGQIPVQTLVH
jgi:hypothetical protein